MTITISAVAARAELGEFDAGWWGQGPPSAEPQWRDVREVAEMREGTVAAARVRWKIQPPVPREKQFGWRPLILPARERR